MGIYKIEHKRPEDSRFANNVNFLACILLASDWFKDNQLLSQLTHAHYRDTVPLTTLASCGVQKKVVYGSMDSLRTADVFPVVASLPPKNNAPANPSSKTISVT